ncbi:LysR family transcriptional regulator [Arthrobacter castelli]|uniref:LysR family transcriptional regulator n=1 Tax=Arthrobacter castelli TaxID=271431 RepID=UPI00068693BC|nr:LysR family transcriptional regulator [Arthrobacter castelli]
MTVDIRTLKTMHVVVRTGSFAAAGRELGFTASAVSQQMSGLERTLKIRLFEREAHRVIPTEAAQYLQHRVEEVVDLLNQVEIDIARLGAGQTGNLRVGTFHSAGGPILGQAIARFLVRRRDVEITLDEGEPYELFPRVSDGSLDIALGFQYDLVPTDFPANLHLTEVMTEDLYIVAPKNHRLAHKTLVDLNELREEKWVAHREETPSHQCLLTLCSQNGFAPDIAFRSNNLGTVKGIVEAGLALAMVPEISLQQNRESIASLPISQRLPRRQIISATRQGDANPLAEAFLQALRKIAEN